MIVLAFLGSLAAASATTTAIHDRALLPTLVFVALLLTECGVVLAGLL